MRASRLMAILLRIQQRGSATAAELAEELEVSVRTIYRDVSALQAAGAPLWTQSGPHGGIHLLDGWRTELDGLTDQEAAALFVGGPPAMVEQLGLGSVLAAAQVKALATLPPDAARRAAEARGRFLLDAPTWFAGEEVTPALPAVAEAVWTSHELTLTYQRATGPVERRVEPLGLVLKAGIWYLVARVEDGLRTYRVSRIVEATATGTPFERPVGFDLEATWAELSADFDRSILTTTVRVRVSPRSQRWLPRAVPTAATVDALAAAGPPDADGWREVELPVESEAIALGQLIGLGAGVEVLEPLSLRRALAATGRELAERNAPA